MNIFIKCYRDLLLLFLIAITHLASAEEMYFEGGHYEALAEIQPIQTGAKIEVAELFWYRCPHCYNLEPFLHAWLKTMPMNAEYVAIPAILGKSWAIHARMFYTLEALNLVDTLHTALYDALHKHKIDIDSADVFIRWVAQHGVDTQKVRAAFDSFGVETKVNFSRVMTQQYGIDGVPAIIVDGKYRTSAALAGGVEELFKVVNYLIKKAQAERVPAPV